MSGVAFQVFLGALSRIGLKCYVPAVVFDELLAKHRIVLEEMRASMKRVRHKWMRLTGKDILTLQDERSLSAHAVDYRTFLLDEFRKHDISLLPYPDVSHQVLVARALERRKPFRDSGAGYRDALLWATLVSFRNTAKGPVAFISNNSKDFGEMPKLHPDLLVDLSAGLNIELFNTVEQFNSARVVPRLERCEGVLRQIQEDRFGAFSLKSWVSRELLDVLNRSSPGDGYAFVGLEPGHGHVWVSAIKEQGELIIDDVRLLPTKRLLVSANVDLKVEVTVSADCEDCARYQDVWDFFDGDCSGSPTVWAEREGNVAFTITLDRDPCQVEWCDIDEITGVYSIEINPHPRREA
jgi:hypothetical protein